jgi:hypothetical protein
MCQICNNEYKGLNILIIDNCPKVVQIPNIQGLNNLNIWNCPNVVQILHIQGLDHLNITNCPKIVQIPHIQRLKRLVIINCPNISQINQNANSLIRLIIYCKYFNSIHTCDKEKIKQYLNIIKITSWYKRMLYLKSKRMKILWRIAEYYTAKKYSPANVFKYLDLND